MANIKKIEGKTGVSYKITVTQGRDSSGKQIRHFKTWKPDRPMTARQMEKAVQRVALDFEREIEMGYQIDNRQTFEQYANYVIDLKEKRGASKRAILQYREFMAKLSPEIGCLKLSDIRPQQLNSFYQKMEEPGSMCTAYVAVAKVDLKGIIKQSGSNQKRFAQECGVSYTIVNRACRHLSIKRKSAERIAEYMDRKCSDLFDISHVDKSLSASTIRQMHNFLYNIFAHAEKEMLIPYNPAAKATPPAAEPYEPDYFQPNDITRILEALEEEPIKWRTMITLLITTGARRGEIMGLKWSKVDLDNQQIKIDASLSHVPGVGIYDGPTKTKNTRYVGIPAEMVLLLRKCRAWQIEQRLLYGDMWVESDYVFTKNTGGPLNPCSLNKWLCEFSKRHNLPYIHPHSFRHTAASILISEGVDIVTVSKMLGHSKTSTTTDIYSHAIEESKRRATECIADVILRRKHG